MPTCENCGRLEGETPLIFRSERWCSDICRKIINGEIPSQNGNVHPESETALMLTKQYARKPFKVRGVQVTADNMNEVAEWCNGTVEALPDGTPFIKVDVKNPTNERQTQAFVTTWVLYAKNGYKVYSDKAFRASFDEIPEIPMQMRAPEDEPETNLEGDENASDPAYAAAIAAQERKLNRP